MATKIQSGNNTAGLANVDVNYRLETTTETNVTDNPNNVGAVKNFSENDDGGVTGSAFLLSPEVDLDYRYRVSQDTILDFETFNYTAQNTGKHSYLNTTMTNAWSANGMRTNSGAITTINTSTIFSTYAMFPMIGSLQTYCEMEVSFDSQPVANTIIDFGLFNRIGAAPYTPTDGIYFRLTSAGMQGVSQSSGTEVTTSVFLNTGATTWSYNDNQKYQFIIVTNERDTQFWIDNQLMGSIPTPAALGQPYLSGSVPFSIRHAIIGGAAGGVISLYISDYTITLGGGVFADSFGAVGNRIYGSYQGLGGGTMGSLAGYANSANPTAAVPTNTTSTVLTALGGQGWEIDSLAVNTDGIIMSYQVPLGTAAIQGRRLRLTGVKIDSFAQSGATGTGGYNAQFSLAFGHTAVSLATAEGAASKAPRRVALGSYAVPTGYTALTQFATINADFSSSPIFVNPGEFIAIAKKKIGTAPTGGVIAYTFLLTYSWE